MKSIPWVEQPSSFPEGPVVVVAHGTVVAAAVAFVADPFHQTVVGAAVDNALVDEPFHRMVGGGGGAAAAVVAFVDEPWEPETK